jgi:hypothetical protein
MFSWGEAGKASCGKLSLGEVRQARYGHYGSLWCGELQLKVPALKT